MYQLYVSIISFRNLITILFKRNYYCNVELYKSNGNSAHEHISKMRFYSQDTSPIDYTHITALFGFSSLKFCWLKLKHKTLDHFSSLVWSKVFVRFAEL